MMNGCLPTVVFLFVAWFILASFGLSDVVINVYIFLAAVFIVVTVVMLISPRQR